MFTHLRSCELPCYVLSSTVYLVMEKLDGLFDQILARGCNKSKLLVHILRLLLVSLVN